MSEGALDLSISSYEVPSQRAAARPHDQASSDSGRASTDSTSSDVHDEIKARRLPSSPHLAASSSPHLATSAASHRAPGLSSTASGSHLPGPVTFPSPSHHRDLPEIPSHLQRPISSSASPPRAPHTEHSGSYSNPNSPVHTATSGGEEDSKPALAADRISDSRVAPIRPFKMYPVDPFNVYSSSLMAGAGGSLSPTPVGMQSLYDTSSPSSFPSFPLTPLTSHLLQRKRRAENRENAAASASSSGTSSTTASGAGNSGGAGGGLGGNGISSVSTSSPGSPRDSGSDGEKRMKSSLDVKKDDAYWDRRRKNNEAAKRSRDARRQKEEEIAMRAAFLEQENLKLRAQVAILKNETAKLHYMLYNRI